MIQNYLEKGRSISDACIDMDTEFLKHYETDMSGTTATFSVVKKIDNQYYVSICNIGDSFTLVLKKQKNDNEENMEQNMNLSFTSKEHKPSDDDERERIVRYGGQVLMNRVNGGLAVSRAFGDRDYKKGSESNPNGSLVISVPDVTDVMCDEGDVIVHICDGITERNTIDEIVKLISDNIDNHKDLAVLCSVVCIEALKSGSTDNLSCMILKLGDYSGQQYAQYDFIPGPFCSERHDFIKAYREACEFNGTTLEDALDKRLKLIDKYDAKLNELMNTFAEIEISTENDQEKQLMEDESTQDKQPTFELINNEKSLIEEIEDILLFMDYIKPIDIDEEKRIILSLIKTGIST
jgi:serine/threonine protein phosphatase PrpC